MRLIDELKRRNVFRVAAAYVLLGWLVIQVTDTVSPALNLPDWTLGLVTWLGIIGLPFALFFAWAFELTPDGIRREQDSPDTPPGSNPGGQKLDIALIALLLITIAYMAWHSSGNGDDGAAAKQADSAADSSVLAAATADQSIAVLPLINMSADSDNAYFAGGVHEEILTNLSRIEGLRVVSRTTALRYVDSDLSLRDIGRDLGVRYIVEGSVRRVNNHVRITVQLIDAANDAHLWASNFDRELVDVFAVQSEVANSITNSLHLEIQPETVGKLDNMPTESVRAYDLYTKALSINRSEPESESALRRQRELLEGAVAEDPRFVEAWAMLNEVLDHSARNILQNRWFGETQQEREANLADIEQAAQMALDRAVALDPDNVETLLAQASNYLLEQKSPEYQLNRKQYVDRALELDPGNAYAWLVLGWWYRLTGDDEAATPAFHKALELDPLNARIVDSSLTHFRLIGDQQMTTLLFERLAQIAPEKADRQELAEIHPVAKLENIIVLFGQTTDESMIPRFADELEKAKADVDNIGESEKLITELRLRLFESVLFQMQDKPEQILTRTPVVLPADADGFAIFLHLWNMANDLVASKVLQNPDQATAIAEQMLEMRERLADAPLEFRNFVDLPMSTAYAQLNDQASLDKVRQILTRMSDEVLFSRMSGPIYGLSVVDTDLAVERILQRKREHPSWYGTDWIATMQVFGRHLIVHPDMQAFYVKEGKWLPYLSARVPEYAQYQQ